MKKLFALCMLFIPMMSYSQERESLNTNAASSSDVIEVTLSVETYWSSGAALYKNYLIVESSEAIGVDLHFSYRFMWDGQKEIFPDWLDAGRTSGRSPIRETFDDPLSLLEVISYSPTQYNGKPIVITIRD